MRVVAGCILSNLLYVSVPQKVLSGWPIGYKVVCSHFLIWLCSSWGHLPFTCSWIETNGLVEHWVTAAMWYLWNKGEYPAVHQVLLDSCKGPNLFGLFYAGHGCIGLHQPVHSKFDGRNLNKALKLSFLLKLHLKETFAKQPFLLWANWWDTAAFPPISRKSV